MDIGVFRKLGWGILALSVLAPCGISAQIVSTLHTFTGANGDGYVPEAGLIMDRAGNLYGTTWYGGTPGSGTPGGNYGNGTVFELVKNSNGSYTETVLYSFTGANGDGSEPQASLIMDGFGNLYGTTYATGPNRTGPGDGICDYMGSPSGSGTVFELVKNSNGSYTEKVLYHFTGQNGDGACPDAGLIMDNAGNLYGTTSRSQSSSNWDNGIVFELVKNSNGGYTEKVLYSFTGSNGDGEGDGWDPEAGLIMDASGNLYGTTDDGGTLDHGSVFELVKNSNGSYTENILYSFTDQNGDGARPLAGLITDGSGNLYGTTFIGGTSGDGTVFELVKNSNGSYTEKVLYGFTGTNGDGVGPFYAGLVMDASANLYGTTFWGGTSGDGTVFELVKNSNGSYTEKVLHSFSGADGYGSQPQAGVIMDASRNLYGTASRGGASNVGTVFEVVSAEIATTTKLTSSSNPATAGDTVAFTATVSSASGTPAGSVTFSIGSSTLGTVALQSGQAAFTVEDAESLGIGTCTITAEYTPAAGSAFLAGSGALAQTVLEFGVALLTGNNAFSGNQNVTGSVTANSFAGNGSNLTNVNAAEPGGVAAAKYARLDIPNLFNGNQSVTGNLGATGVLKTTGTLVVGNLGTPITEHLSVLVNPGFAALQPLSCASAAFTLTGAANGGTIALGVPTARMTGGGTLLYTAWVSAPNQVTLRACNIDSKAAQKIAGSGAIRVDIWRH